ncbi:response regulator NasT [Mobilisporobacter senegalensis]|uniref:Response regulator NasT n=1 Tax=Mobilisporobacter senegalensis TaxID=1329262 RepID=A0A3N1XL62_9FIRM|nr:ANTAR domain-containing protein [Mobilisporobacter senegalensis]ROR27449.1 response regulator NasT [Mobilisporobacter senegalensis]
MVSIIIAFPKIEDAKNIKNILLRNGYDVDATCTSGAGVLNIANELDGGIVLCGYKLPDMQYNELMNYLPKGFNMLLVASPKKFEDCINNDIVCLGMPIKTRDLLDTLQMMTYNYSRRKKREANRPKERNEEAKKTIAKAKAILMERNNMSEEEAHRYIQKTSMDSGTKMVETAEMILSLM